MEPQLKCKILQGHMCKTKVHNLFRENHCSVMHRLIKLIICSRDYFMSYIYFMGYFIL